jgi:hypothetical protein
MTTKRTRRWLIARGVMRLTRDIDATIVGGGTDLEALLDVL